MEVAAIKPEEFAEKYAEQLARNEILEKQLEHYRQALALLHYPANLPSF